MNDYESVEQQLSEYLCIEKNELPSATIKYAAQNESFMYHLFVAKGEPALLDILFREAQLKMDATNTGEDISRPHNSVGKALARWITVSYTHLTLPTKA